MRRRVVHPYGQSISPTRLASLILAVAVLWMIYERMRDPATWKMFADGEPAIQPVEPSEKVPHEVKETIVPGPNHKDEDEMVAAQRNFEYVIDKAPLKSREMDAYWRLMAWSRTEPFADLEKQARRDVPFTLLWEQPERYRGQPIRLRMHARRVLEHDKPENSLGLANVYEAWGPTDESGSLLYAVVIPERPDRLPIGDDIRGEIVFVGYFLKIMFYEDKLGKPRGAPLLIGRAQFVATPSTMPTKSDTSTVLTAILVGGALLVGSLIWMGMRPRRKSSVKTLPGELPSLGSLDGNSPVEDLLTFDTKTEPADIGHPVVASPEVCNTANSGVSH
ncbi:MAG: hypothetical protein H7062_08960 [Candidatus Saccharimonas sp.]|nr:hypothetical protein [Planctomycetaceae bacterium]